MGDLIKRALTRRRKQRGRWVQEEPNEKLVYVVKFSLVMTVCLTAVEITHLVVLRTWNSEAFAALTGLIGTVTGIFVGQKS